MPGSRKKPDLFPEPSLLSAGGELYQESASPFSASPSGNGSHPHSEPVYSTPDRQRWLLSVLLFLATFLTTSLAGLFNSGYSDGGLLSTYASIARNPFLLIRGLPFSLTLITILLAHEMGHFLACRHYGIRCTPPFFMPLPIPPAGTLGAFIRIQSPFQHKRALFDVGVAGPLAGFAFVIPALVLGVLNSQIIPKGAMGDGMVSYGEPLLFRWVSGILVGYNPETEDMIAHPVAFAAWFGLLVTALNLLPIWQLDGGHMTYALFGPRFQKRLSIVAAIGLILVSFLGWPPSYLLFGMLLLILGSRFRFYHPPTLADEEDVGPGRVLIAIVALVILIISFTPVPFSS